jgi:hypothetical protein
MIIKVNNGRLCGGYCSIGWKSSGNFKYDYYSFLFSLDLLKKYDASSEPEHGEHILHDGTGPSFGMGASLGLSSPMNHANCGHCNINL